MKIPTKIPEKGFYYHYKRDPDGPFNYAAYEVLGTAFSTESEGSVHSDNPNDFLKDEVVIYRPLFKEALVYKAGRDFWTRPHAMFLEKVTIDGKEIDRFQKITDPTILADLEKIRDEMYSYRL